MLLLLFLLLFNVVYTVHVKLPSFSVNFSYICKCALRFDIWTIVLYFNKYIVYCITVTLAHKSYANKERAVRSKDHTTTTYLYLLTNSVMRK